MDPPRFRAGSDDKRCGTCQYFLGDVKEGASDWGRCANYDRPVIAFELCDSWNAKGVVLWAKGRRQA